MAAETFDYSWMWHPHFREDSTTTAGRFVHFRRTVCIAETVSSPLLIHITADTRYKLYVNGQLASFGPVKGDANIWFYDEIDVAPYMKVGWNKLSVHVVRLFHGTSYGTSFPRLGSGGLRIKSATANTTWLSAIESSEMWETAIDCSTILPINQKEDDFLHLYQRSLADYPSVRATLEWVPVKLLRFQSSTGVTAPWKLSPRMIAQMRIVKTHVSSIHNLRSDQSGEKWLAALKGIEDLTLASDTDYDIDIEVPHHTTAFLNFRFKRPSKGGSMLSLTYSEGYEDTPKLVPYLRCKTQRCDTTKDLIGPKDTYIFEGEDGRKNLSYHENEESEEYFAPFHWRTFRFMRLRITTQASELTFRGLDIDIVQYPLEVSAQLRAGPEGCFAEKLLETSVRTLQNCMHECYEDCPFYEQLQYAFDTRSSALFTYNLSADDRLARQAIVQLHSSFQPSIGLTASRAPSAQLQIIPHFSLYWVCMLRDHLMYFDDKAFIRRFLPQVDAVLDFFHFHVHEDLGLVLLPERKDLWHFHDWTDEWKPYGIPPSVLKSGVSTYTNGLYAYTLSLASHLQEVCCGRRALAQEYTSRASSIGHAMRQHCFNGSFFTDSLSHGSDLNGDLSQHSQVWAVLGGAVSGVAAAALLKRTLLGTEQPSTKTSTSMAFYTLRAVSKAGSGLYEELFHDFWKPWQAQLELGLTTWVEDDVSLRSDCHAWGSVPVYELICEVAGVHCAEDGWAAVYFSPRVSLYAEFKASIPIARGGVIRSVYVEWQTATCGQVDLLLNVSELLESIPMIVKLPGENPVELVGGQEPLSFTCQVGKSHAERTE